MDTHMERTQVYFPKTLKKRIKKYSAQWGGNFSEAIRRGMERILDEEEQKQQSRKKTQAEFRKALDRAFGIWKDRDPKEFEEIRRSADRRLDEWGV